jgi:hypothetical protein
MAWGNGGLFVVNMIGALSGGQAVNFLTTSHKIALYNNSITPDYGVTAANSAYNVDQWATANEVYGTNWAQAGKTLATAGTGGGSTNPAMTQSPAGTLKYDLDDVIVASATFSNASGCFIYGDSYTPKIGLVAVPFGGAYSPNNGTFTIQWPAAGVFTIDLTP